MPKTSAGLLMFRVRAGTVQVLLVHPGGPLWKNKDDSARRPATGRSRRCRP
jgi:predicted NUDIX family NTP pyrophosphohydrolase